MFSPSETMFSNLSGERSKRSSNFSSKEVKYLIQLVDSKKEIIESKKSDRSTSEDKVKAWMEIEEKFNAAFDDYRNLRVLKTKYDNLKKCARRKMPANVSNLSVLKMLKSTETAYTNEPSLDADDNLSDENTQNNSLDSDIDMKPRPPLNAQELDAAAEEYVFETLLFGEPQTSSPKRQQNTESKLPEVQTKPVVEKKKSPTVDVWEQVAHKKLKKLDLEITVIKEEWLLKRRRLELEEEKLKVEIEVLKQKLQNNNNNS